MTQQRYMLIFSIGPVQSLIAQARKTRDLWLGSYLLAKLMEAAMQGIGREKLVFPANPTVEKSIADLPNKYIALFDLGKDAKDVAEQSIVDTKALWETVQKQVKAKVFRNTSIHAFRDMQERDRIWDQQTSFDSFFEVYWVAVPEPTADELKEEQARPGNAEKTRYQLWLEKVQTAFDARKRLRDFQKQDEFGEKSTISGEREVLHGAGTSRQAIREYWRKLAGNHPVKDIYHDGSERLDAIDTIKRFALYAEKLQPKNPQTQKLEKMDFPSTSSIATASFVKLLLKKLATEQNTDLEVVLKKWLKLTENGGLAEMQSHAIPYLYQLAGNDEEYQKILKRDGDCFFEETFVPETLHKGYPEAKTNPIEAAQALKNLREAAGAGPTAYYALIQMDGDHIGTIINGVKEQTPHREISKALSDFAREKRLKL